MNILTLKNDVKVLIDGRDFKRTRGHNWFLTRNGQKRGPSYVRADVWANGKRTRVTLHRLIMKAKPGQIVDHINCDTLDNRRSNLRFATPLQNVANSRISKRNKSGYKGVFWNKNQNRFQSKVRVDGKYVHLGNFKDPIDAYCAYCVAAKLIYGEFARFE